jgi:hypothetical protein
MTLSRVGVASCGFRASNGKDGKCIILRKFDPTLKASLSRPPVNMPRKDGARDVRLGGRVMRGIAHTRHNNGVSVAATPNSPRIPDVIGPRRDATQRKQEKARQIIAKIVFQPKRWGETGRGTGATAPAAVARRVVTTVRVVISPAPKRQRQSSASGVQRRASCRRVSPIKPR